MSAPIKGYGSKNKSGHFEYATVERVGEDQLGLTSVAQSFYEVMVSDAAEANTTAISIVATAHVARIGDIIRFTSGANSGYKRKVESIPDANTITVLEDFPAAAGVGDTFQILRSREPTVDQLGASVTASKVQFMRNAVLTDVTEDTVVPANNIPLPVKLSSVTGDINITANDLNVQLSHSAVNFDSTRIGDGTDLLDVVVEDAASVGGETGTLSMAVRNSANAVTTSADGDYGTLTIDDTGRLRVDATITEAATAADGALGLPAVVKVIGGWDGANVQAIATDANGELQTDILSVTPGVAATSLGKAEDAVHASGDVGVMSLAVRNDAAAALTSADGDYSPIAVDSAGRAKVVVDTLNPGTGATDIGKAEDAVHGSGDTGVMSLGVRNDASAALTSADGDYSPIAVDSAGRPKVIVEGSLPAGTNNIGDVDVLSVIPGVAATSLGKAEDAVHASGDTGVMALAVRNDAAAALTSADGDYSPLAVDSAGRAKVVVDTFAPGTGATDLGKAEDAVHASGDVGVMSLAVRNDAAAALTSADGDYSPIAVDSAGRPKTVVDSIIPGVTATSLGKAEDAAHVSGDTGVMLLGVRNDASAVLTSADGDYSALAVDSAGRLKTVGSVTVGANTAGNSPGSSTVAGVATLTAPANAVGFILMNLDTSTANMRYRIGAAATTTSGQQLQPGRDTGFIPCAANISIIAESGTQDYDVQWILSS